MKKLEFSFGKKLPIILQTEITECGIACITMIAIFYGHEVDLLSIRRLFPVSLHGSNLQDLMYLGKELDLSSRAIKLELKDLKNLKTPCVLHWDMNHFVVLKSVVGNTVYIHDPAIGVVKYKLSEVSNHFTGIALELTPITDFKKRNNKTELALLDLWGSIKGFKLSLLQIILISLALEVFAIISPLYMQFITDSVIITKDFSLAYTLATGFTLLTIIQIIISYSRSWIVLYLSNNLNIQLVSNLIRHLFKLPISFFEKRHIGDIISRFNSISKIQDKISTAFIESIVDGIMVIATLVMMLIYSKLLSLVVFIALILYVIVRASLYPIIKLQTQESLIASAKENSVFIESVRAILPLKVFKKEGQRENIWQNHYVDKLNANIRLSKIGLIYQSLNQLIFGLEYVLVVLFGAISIMNGEFSIGMLFAYLAYRGQFVSKAQNMIDKVVEYKMIRLHLDRVADIALTEPEQENKNTVIIKKIIQGAIEVKNLTFRYSEQEPYLFKEINFDIKAGESVAIIGSSGCGKTTLIKVMMYLINASSGEILIDGTSIKNIGVNFYRSCITAVMQEDILLTGSIAENICFFDENPNFELIYISATIAAIHNDIMKMPMSYETLVGDMGNTLSGGQKQRVLLARALYQKPKILFLDEATSHLDKKNEDIVNQNLKKLGITRIIVAHRYETIAMADRVINLNKLKV